MAILFWASVVIIVYTYLGYGILIGLILWARRMVVWTATGKSKLAATPPDTSFEPEVVLVVAAYNEKECIEEKARNSLELDYPQDKLRFLFVTDGSDDGTVELLRPFHQISVLHQPQRRGKVAAVNRALHHVSAPIAVFSDANSLLNRSAVRQIVKHYQDPQVGGVSGEKRVLTPEVDSASGSGEGLYWRYESLLKKMDAAFYSVVGAAGELFSVRTAVVEPVPDDTILDDFFISLQIARRGYRIAYEPKAYSLEKPSPSIGEEFWRKARTCAGGFQAMFRLRTLLNPFQHGWLTFQYVSHRVLRWTVAPLALLALIPINFRLAYQVGGLYNWLLVGQLLFYLVALAGWFLESRRLRLKLFFIPFYFSMMNLAVYAGFWRFIAGRQTVLWEKVSRR